MGLEKNQASNPAPNISHSPKIQAKFRLEAPEALFRGGLVFKVEGSEARFHFFVDYLAAGPKILKKMFLVDRFPTRLDVWGTAAKERLSITRDIVLWMSCP